MNFFDSWLEQFVTEHPDVTSDIAELKAAMTAGKASIQQVARLIQCIQLRV